MSTLSQLIDQVRKDIQIPNEVIKEARARRDVVRDAAEAFPDAIRSFGSGSLQHRTAIAGMGGKDTHVDADAGVVIDRRRRSELGPDGAGEGPCGIAEEVRDFVGKKIRETYKKATLHLDGQKRSILVKFHAPLSGGEDPTADLIVALDRRGQPGLWIPQFHQDSWDPSHPEKHTELITGGGESLWRTRRYAIRVGKAWNNLHTKRPLCSFNTEVLAYEAVKPGMGLSEALAATLRHGASTLPNGLTRDPAGVSKDISLPNGKDHAVKCLTVAADDLERALDDPDNEDLVREVLANLFPGLVTAPEANSSLAELAMALRSGNDGVSVRRGGLALGSAGAAISTTPAFGHEE